MAPTNKFPSDVNLNFSPPSRSIVTCALTPESIISIAVPDCPEEGSNFGTKMAAVPSKLVPLIVLAVANAVAVAAFPVHEPDEPAALPVKFATNSRADLSHNPLLTPQ